MLTPSYLFSGARRFRPAFVLTAVCLALAALCVSQAFPTRGRAEARRAEAAARPAPRSLEAYGKLPLRFEANRGQTGGEVKFLARGAGYTLFLSDAGATLRLRRDAPKSDDKPDALARSGARTQSSELAKLRVASAKMRDESTTLRVRLEGSNRTPKVSGVEEMQGRINYLVGRDPRGWQTGVPAYAKVKYESVYPGVDMVYYGSEGRLEYDFLVAPGADARRISLKFDGARSTRVEENGDLLIKTDGGDVRQHKPLAYQYADGARREVAARYVKDKRGAVRIELGDYDRALPLVIDPVLVYSSYIGGSGSDNAYAVAVDSAGSAYVAGYTTSAASGPAGTKLGSGGFADAFVVKLSPDGKSFAYVTYIGGNSDDFAFAVSVDSGGNAYAAGYTGSADFPVTAGAPQTSFAGGPFDAFVAKLDSTGSALTYATYLGGGGVDAVFDLAINGSGAAYVAGYTDSLSFNGFPSATRTGSPAFKSTDAGSNWSASASGLNASTVYDFAVAPSAPDTVYAATNLGVFKSTGGGSTWQLAGQSNPSTAPPFATAVAVDPANASVVYAGSSNGGIYKSTDGGATFTAKNTGLFLTIVNSLVVDPSSPSTVYASTALGVYKTTNGGDIWSQSNGGGLVSLPNTYKLVIDPSNTQTLYAGTNRGVFKTTNGGGTWTAVNNGLINDFEPMVRALAISPSNPSTLYAYAQNFDTGVYKTTDGGANWTKASGGLSGVNFFIGVNVLLVDPSSPSIVYAGTSNAGVYRTTDGGANWLPSNVGLPNKNVTGLGVRAAAPAAVYAGVSVGGDALAAKLNTSGSQFDYVRVFGGGDDDSASGLAVGADGSAYVSGKAASTDFPTSSAFQSALKGSSDAFVAKLGPTGTTVYSTLLGGSSDDQSEGLDVGADGSAYVTGSTVSLDFPLANALQPARGDNHPFPVTEVFVTKLAPTGQSLTYSTYLGGDGLDEGLDIKVGADGSAYVTGVTNSSNFPTQAPSNARAVGRDAFVTKINPAGSALLFSTYFGGSFEDIGNAIAIDSLGAIYVAGIAGSTDLPVVNSADPTHGGTNDGFIAKFGEESDLSVTMSDSRDPVTLGSPLTYTLLVTNGGPSTATGVTLTDTLPAGLSYVSAVPTQGSCGASGQVVTCDIGHLADEGTATVQLNVNTTAAGTLSNTAHVSAAEPDHTASNNDATETTRVSASPTISGHVTGAGGGGLSGVTLTLSGSQSSTTQTDAAGFYQFIELPAGGDYTITPSKAGVSFEPPSRSFNGLGADQTADFVATDCTWTLSAALASFGAAGGTGTVTVTTLHGCPWNAASSADWLTITSGASGTETGVVSFSVAPTTQPRVAHLSIAGQSFPVYQEFGACGAPLFSVANYGLGGIAATIAKAADLDGDGDTDLLMATDALSGADIAASVLINNGAGGFKSNSFLTGFGLPKGYAFGDFNGDKRPDLAIWSFAAKVVGIRYNDGAGNFISSTAGLNFDTNVGPNRTSVIAADVNRDGKDDLIVSTPESNNIRVMLGDGAGNFTAATPVVTNVGNAVFDLLAVEDFSGDGKLDLLLESTNAPQFSVRLGDGAGGFGPDIISPTNSISPNALNTLRVVTGDFDGDGKLDIVYVGLVCDLSFNCATSLVVMAGDGAGRFSQKSRADNLSISQMTAADLNRDGKLDVVYTLGGHSLAWRAGDGLGGFGSPMPFSTGPETQFQGVGGIVSADFNGDGRPDIAVSDYTLGATVLRNNCAASFISGRITTAGGTPVAGVTVTLSGAQSATTQTDDGGNFFFGGLTAGANYVVTPSKEPYDFAPQSVPVNNLSGGQAVEFIATAKTVSLARNHYLVDENLNTSLIVEVVRSGSTLGAASVIYSTGDTDATVPASERSDYTRAVGTLNFAPGEATKSFTVLLNDDALVEGFEGFTVNIGLPSGAILGSTSTALVEIRDNDFAAGANLIDGSTFFVRQHYHDFLNREPDAAGLAFWVNEIEKCNNDSACRDVRRINVSAAFFLSIEFQETGYLVYRAYKAAYGDATSPGVPGTVPVMRLDDFLPDTQQIGSGLQVGVGDWQAKLEANKAAYFQEFVTRRRFTNAAPVSMTPAQFVDALFQHAGVTPTAEQRQAAIDEFGGASNTADTAARGRALRRVAENPALSQLEKNRAFVLMEYFGYLRRNPDAAPQIGLNYSGWKFWLGKLEEFNGNFIAAEMVKAFISSDEYRKRFGN